DHEFRLELLGRVPERVGQHEPSFGVGIDDLDGLPRHRRDDIAGALRIAVGHVLDHADDAHGVDLGLARGEHLHKADHAGCARHVALHILHAAGRLDRNAAGIETYAFADKGDRRVVFLVTVPAHDNHAAVAARALPNAEQRTHAELLHRLYVKHVDGDAMLP